MTVRIRLQRQGKPKRPFYKIVAIDQRAKRDGRPLESLGQYDPMAQGETKVKINKERLEHWLKVGASATDTVAALLKIGPVKKFIPKVKAEKKEETKA